MGEMVRKTLAKSPHLAKLFHSTYGDPGSELVIPKFWALLKFLNNGHFGTTELVLYIEVSLKRFHCIYY